MSYNFPTKFPQTAVWSYGCTSRSYHLLELDDGKIDTGKPDISHGKNHGTNTMGFRLRFSQENQSIDTSYGYGSLSSQ